ncbi:MAG: alpha-glucosidase/alpha-galactosidase [Ardenticatenaceae bacterium]|nr:alpha-glucosidase/alpha-galactosidase [Ardenticatenaceae bacterium]
MTKITFIGAGSTVFAKNLMGDILSFPELKDVTLSLMDIDPQRLRTSEIVACKVAEATGSTPKIEATTDRRAALQGADYVLCMIQVGGYRPSTVIDFDIPQKYGLRQTIADTLGIGGIMRGLRTIPVLLDICRDMEEVCPNALFINYVNPMAINQWALSRATGIKTVGLCHSVPHTAAELCSDLGLKAAEVNYVVAGINHMAFFLKFEHQGQTLYPQLREKMAHFEQTGRFPQRGHRQMTDRVRYELFKRLGYFVTESSEHLSEYLPYFIKRDRPDLIDQFEIPLDEYIGRCEEQIALWDELREYFETSTDPIQISRSVEYGSLIIHSLETGQPRTVYGNVPNHNLIPNLPQGCTVELPCLVDANGLQPTHIGQLPPQLAALMRTNINVQELTVEAALTGKREHIYHAAMLDPHTAAELDLDQIHHLVDDLIEAHGDWLPVYQ